jgi:YggT family protein
MHMSPTFQTVLDVASKGLLILAVVAGAICIVDWAIRARHINPFNPVARFFRRWIDPLLKPLETMIVRRGGQPQQAPFYAFMTVIVGGIAILYLLRFFAALYFQLRAGLSSPGQFGFLVIGWALNFLVLALIVRVVSSWLPVSPFSKWIRWSYVSTEWFMAPLRRVIPPFGQIDLSPLVAYFLLRIVGGVLGV